MDNVVDCSVLIVQERVHSSIFSIIFVVLVGNKQPVIYFQILAFQTALTPLKFIYFNSKNLLTFGFIGTAL